MDIKTKTNTIHIYMVPFGYNLGTNLFLSSFLALSISTKTQNLKLKNSQKGTQKRTQFLKGACAWSSTSSSRSFGAILLLATVLTGAVFRPALSDPSDEACLTHLSQSLQDPNRSLKNWTKSTFANPCSGFTSYLQGAICNNGRIYKLSLTSLSLRGSISPFLANCTNLQALDLSSNFITGPIPAELQFLVNLAVLNLSSNRLQGPIPPQLTLCAYLNVIDLHQNLLTDTIPQQLGLLVRLSAFDVSNNKLSGPIPSSLGNRSGSLPRFNATSFLGNKELYGYPLPPLKTKGLSVLAIVGIGLGSGFASLVLSFTGVCIWLKITERKMALEEGKITQLMPDY